MIEDREIMGFPDASKLIGKKVSLSWRKVDLYALAFQCLGNDPQNGKIFRDHIKMAHGLLWERDSANTAWMLPQPIRIDEEMQKKIFHSMTGPHMASGPSGHKRGFPYTWLANHLADGREQVSPRSFNAALRAAAEYDQNIPIGWRYPLHFRGLYNGVQRASAIRVDEVTEDFPWVEDVMQPLRQLVVPCSASEFLSRWKREKTADKIRNKKSADKLPPQHVDEGPNGLLEDLQSLDIIQRLSDDRIQMPDVYRIAFGLGRRGGVKPVK